jgi:hypothetical protein
VVVIQGGESVEAPRREALLTSARSLNLEMSLSLEIEKVETAFSPWPG